MAVALDASRRLRQPGPRQAGRPDARSALRVFLRRSRLELESDKPLIADHPRVVAGLDDVRLARTDLDLGAVLVLDGQPAGVNNADMAGLAAPGSGDGLDTFRPPPPRLESHPCGCRHTHTHDIHLRLVRRPRLVRRIEVARFHTGTALSSRRSPKIL